MLRLQYTPPSPTARKVLVAAHEMGVVRDLILEDVDVWSEALERDPDNPLGKIPVLICEEGTFYGSGLICEYLSARCGDSLVIPSETARRWASLRVQALADGLVDAAISHKLERNRPEGMVWPHWLERQEGKIIRTLRALEQSPDLDLEGATIGTITLAVALSYLGQRVPDVAWKDTAPRIATWHEKFQQRPSMTATKA